VTSGLRVGIVGAGFMGRVHLAALAAEGVAATVMDPHPGRAATLAEDHGADVCGSLDELIHGVDVVDICAPTHRHTEIAIAAAGAGRHVICEKPLARTLDDAEAVIAACSRSGVRLFVAQVVRYFPEYVAARRALLDGAVGEPAVLRLKRAAYRPRVPPDHWLLDRDKSGRVVVDLMIHDFDMARWLAGDVVTVHCRSAAEDRPDLEVDHAVATLTHASGAISQVSGSWAYGTDTFRTAFEIAGSRGLISYDSATAQPIVSYLGAAPSQEAGAVGLPQSPAAEDPYRLELREFLAAIERGVPARVQPADGLEALRIALAAEASARTGQVVHLPGAST
jgi:predicted dehydrogenase